MPYGVDRWPCCTKPEMQGSAPDGCPLDAHDGDITVLVEEQRSAELRHIAPSSRIKMSEQPATTWALLAMKPLGST